MESLGGGGGNLREFVGRSVTGNQYRHLVPIPVARGPHKVVVGVTISPSASGLVCRQLDPNDRRRVLIELTPAGIEIAQRGDKAYGVTRERILSAMPSADIVRIDQAITTMLNGLEEDQEKQAGSGTEL